MCEPAPLPSSSGVQTQFFFYKLSSGDLCGVSKAQLSKLSRQGVQCPSLGVYIVLRSLLSREEESGEPGLVEESSGVPAGGQWGDCQKQDIVQRSASEQTHTGPCIWYSKQM